MKSSLAGAKISSIFIKQVSFLFMLQYWLIVHLYVVRRIFFCYGQISLSLSEWFDNLRHTQCWTPYTRADSFYSESIQWEGGGENIYKLRCRSVFHELSKLLFIEHFFICEWRRIVGVKFPSLIVNADTFQQVILNVNTCTHAIYHKIFQIWN